MKSLRRLSTIYIIGLGFLVITILVAVFSFKEIYTSTGEILRLTAPLSAEGEIIPFSGSAEFMISISKAVPLQSLISFMFPFPSY